MKIYIENHHDDVILKLTQGVTLICGISDLLFCKNDVVLFGNFTVNTFDLWGNTFMDYNTGDCIIPISPHLH